MNRFFYLLLMAALIPMPSRAATLLQTDFDKNASSIWSNVSAAPSAKGIRASVALRSVGTIDVAGSAQPSKALLLTVSPNSKIAGSAALVSGLLPVKTTETNLGKLTLSFSLLASSARPITVRIASFDAKKKRTGGLVGQIFPAAPDFYQRYAVDLNTLKPIGIGKFQPTAPYVQFSFEGEGGGPSQADNYQLRLDNVNYATPAYYVSPNGSNTNDGLTEKTAFATPQKALDSAQPGDICVLMDGTYDGGTGSAATFPRAGTPDAWISLKNYPGQKPTLTATGWNIVNIRKGTPEHFSNEPTLAYLEVRGMHIRGEGDVAKKKYPEAMNKSNPLTNSNGISIDGRAMKDVPHHFRIADNVIEYCPGAGIGELEADWVTYENNVCRYNCWTTIYACSGITMLGATNFDATVNTYRMLVRNNVCYRNECFEIWESVHHVSDGNGIIIDINQHSPDRPNGSFTGRTLVQSNLCFDNGGSGIHTVQANRVDIINNTVYLNSASKALQYSEMFVYASEDVHFINNIMVAPVADVAAGEKPEPVNTLSGKINNVTFAHNVYFGGNIPPTLGEGDVIADPQFVNPTRDGSVADFHLKPSSLAIGKGTSLPFSPFLDLDGKPRKSPPTLGVYEK